MAGFTTLAIAGLAGAGLLAASRGKGNSNEGNMGNRGRRAPLAPGPGAGNAPATGSSGERRGGWMGRRKPENVDAIGRAVPRPRGGEDMPEPPDAGRDAAAAAGSAQAAAARARRKGASVSLLSGLPVGRAVPARLQQRSLLSGGS